MERANDSGLPISDPIFSFGGAASEAMRQVDWAGTAVGPVAGWPASLKNLVRTMLASRQAMALYWGRDLVQFYNDAALPIFGAKHPSAMGRLCADSWQEAWSVISIPLLRVLDHGESFLAENQLIPITRVDALEDAWWTYSYSPVYDGDAIAGSLTIVTETTQFVLARRELEVRAAENVEARADAEAANRAKDMFLATLSHELRTPMMAIVSWSELLRGEPDRARLAKGLAVIDRNARAQSRLIDDILDVSRIVAGKLALKLGSVDLARLVATAGDSVRPLAEKKGVEFIVELGERELHLEADEDRVLQVLWNLLTNAVKFTPKGGRVQTRVWRSEHGAHIRVSDTGLGIPATFLPFVFESFSQSDITRTREGGLGLGLSIARRLIDLHGGSVRALSDGEGKGACFEVTLPMTSRVVG